MKKTQFIELINTIKNTLVSFVSITIFVALGVAIYVGISWTSSAIVGSIDDNIKETNFHDIQILFPYGMDEQDIAELKKIQGVDEVEGAYLAYTYFGLNGQSYQAKLIQLHDKMDLPFNVEGELPTKYNEVLLDKVFANDNNIKIGDTIYFVGDNDGSSRSIVTIVNFNEEVDDIGKLDFKDEKTMAYLKTDRFKVTGLANNTEFLNNNKNNYGISPVNKLAIDCFAYLPKSAFDENSFAGYTEVLIRSNELSNYSITDNEYTTKVSNLADEIKTQLLEYLVNNKNIKIHETIDNINSLGEDKLNEASNEISELEIKIQNGNSELAKNKEILDNSLIELQNAEAELARAQSEYDANASRIDEIEGYLNSLREVANTSVSDVANNRDAYVSRINDAANLARNNGYNEVATALNLAATYIRIGNIDGALTVINEAVSSLESVISQSRNELNQASTELNEAKKKIENGYLEYNNGLKLFESKQIELNDAIVKLNQAKEELDKEQKNFEAYKDKTTDIGDYGYTVLTRKFNAGLVIGESLNTSFVKVRFSMAALFIVVGLLVCYSSLSRIVSDQVVLIGTKKALGVSDDDINGFYLCYALITIIVGCVLGGLIGYFVVEKILVTSIDDIFWCDFHLYFSIEDYLLICLIHYILLLLVTYFACRKVLKRNAVDLLRDDKFINNKQRFYEKSKLWHKLSLLSKTIINNFFNDKQRVFGTIVGIAGSTALIVTALTLNDNVLDSFKRVYDDYYHFDTIVFYDEENTEAKNNIKNYFVENDIPCSNIYFTRMFNVTPSNEYVMSYLFIPGGSNGFDGLITLKSIEKDNKDIYDGYWMCYSYYNCFKPTQGDSIKLINYDGDEKSIVPNGFFDYYLVNYQNIMDKQTYRDSYGKEPIPNAYLIECGEKNLKDIEEDLEKINGYVTYIDFYGTTYQSFTTFANISKVMVMVYMALAIVMYLLVVLNLMTMFIMEKKKELIVMMVNGYSVKQAKKYIYADTIFLSIIGIMVGIIIGIVMGALSVSSFETSVTVFLHRIDLKACVIALCTSSLMIFIISLIALKRIDKFTLSDINEL